MKEYIVPVDEDDADFDEMFIGNIRDEKELIRCKDCKYSVDEYDDGECYCNYTKCLQYVKDWNHYCAWAEQKGKPE